MCVCSSLVNLCYNLDRSDVAFSACGLSGTADFGGGEARPQACRDGTALDTHDKATQPLWLMLQIHAFILRRAVKLSCTAL
jgi:hypothetical protein